MIKTRLKIIMENCVPTIASDEICIPNQSTSIDR